MKVTHSSSVGFLGTRMAMARDFYLCYHVGHKGKCGHEVLEFKFQLAESLDTSKTVITKIISQSEKRLNVQRHGTEAL